MRVFIICAAVLAFAAAAGAADNPVQQGKSLVEQNGCSACHTQGGVAPALDTLAAGKSDVQLKEDILHPKKAIGPSTVMPTFNFNDEQLKAIIDYLRSISKS